MPFHSFFTVYLHEILLFVILRLSSGDSISFNSLNGNSKVRSIVEQWQNASSLLSDIQEVRTISVGTLFLHYSLVQMIKKWLNRVTSSGGDPFSVRK